MGSLRRMCVSPEDGAHQLRVHLTSIDHPILGDKTYGGAKVMAVAGYSGSPSDAACPHVGLHIQPVVSIISSTCRSQTIWSRSETCSIARDRGRGHVWSVSEAQCGMCAVP